MVIELSSFNENQLAAVRWQNGPLLVLAGPGSGKTRVLTYRIARLIEESKQAHFRVLAVTFTNKAASEMRSRIDSISSAGRERATLTTFHSFAAEILRQHGSHIGLRPDFAILSEQADREAVLANAIQSAQQEEYLPSGSQILPVIDRMLSECISVDNANAWLGSLPQAAQIARVYSSYRTHLIANNQMDFASLIAGAVELLDKKPAIARLIHRVYPYVCVDEFQDTNAAQFGLLVRLLPEANPNLFVVADDDQLIYQWNGASPARLRALREQLSMKVIQLPENYRCPHEVIELANNLISHNSDRTPDKVPITATKKADDLGRVTVLRFRDFEAEMAWLVEELGATASHERTHCVVLARRRKLLEELVVTLAENSIAAHIGVRRNEFQSMPFRWLHAMLRIANAPQEREQLRRVSRAYFELEGININDEDVVARAALNQGGFLRSWLDVADERVGTEMPARKVLASARDCLLERLDYWNFVDASLDWFAVLKAGSSETVLEEFTDELEIWEALKTEIAGHYSLTALSLHSFLQELDLRAKEKPVPKDAVRCLTIAASKGLEFRHVFLIGLVEDELPSFHARKKGDESDAMREERRNCFVAITRAEETLSLTFSDRYSGWNRTPSRFLAEMGVSAS